MPEKKPSIREKFLTALQEGLKEKFADALMKKAVASAPFLGVWPVSMIASYFITKILNTLFKEAAFVCVLKHTDLRTSKEGQGYMKAIAEYHKLKEQGADPTDIALQEKKVAENLNILIRFSA